MLLICSTALAQDLFVNSTLENFKLASIDKLKELYDLREIYLDSSNTNGTEGVQVFISEIRKNVYLANNAIDLAFLYNLYKRHDPNTVVQEYVAMRVGDINDNVKYNITTLDNVISLLRLRSQEKLVRDIAQYKERLVTLTAALDEMEASFVPQKPQTDTTPPRRPKQ